MTKETYYSEKCVAKKWGLSQKTLQRWRLTGEGPEYVKFGGRVRYSETAINKFEDEGSLDKKSKDRVLKTSAETFKIQPLIEGGRHE